jgi:hypothetical protein
LKGIHRGDERGFAGGPPSGEACGEKSSKACEEEAPRIDCDIGHAEENVVGSDGGGDGVEKSTGDLKAEKNSKARTEER